MEKRNAYRILVGKPEGKRPLGRPRHRWVDNIKMDLREIGWGGMDWTDLAQVNLSRYCKDQDIEMCALKLEPVVNICVLAVYRAPSGNFISFLSGLDNIISSLYKAESKFIICGDTNIDYLKDSEKKAA
jgi:hypothetical protein